MDDCTQAIDFFEELRIAPFDKGKLDEYIYTSVALSVRKEFERRVGSLAQRGGTLPSSSEEGTPSPGNTIKPIADFAKELAEEISENNQGKVVLSTLLETLLNLSTTTASWRALNMDDLKKDTVERLNNSRDELNVLLVILDEIHSPSLQLKQKEGDNTQQTPIQNKDKQRVAERDKQLYHLRTVLAARHPHAYSMHTKSSSPV